MEKRMPPETETLTIMRPDDFHLHLRDADYLNLTVPDAARQFGRAIIMPNLVPPILDVKAARAYRDRILKALPPSLSFKPMMTLYLTDQTTPQMIKEAAESDCVYACKLYPAGVTTHSQLGVTDIVELCPIFSLMQKYDLPLLLHGEINRLDVDIFDREKYFLTEQLKPLLLAFPELRIVLEHISTAEAVNFVKDTNSSYLAATITPHHLLLSRNHLLKGNLNPHHYCLPILQTEVDRAALIDAATSGNPQFFLGTDSAPHIRRKKEAAAVCAGIYSSHAALPLYATVFEKVGFLHKLEFFASIAGACFYKLPINQTEITLVKKTWQVPAELKVGENETLVPFCANTLLDWQVVS